MLHWSSPGGLLKWIRGDSLGGVVFSLSWASGSMEPEGIENRSRAGQTGPGVLANYFCSLKSCLRGSLALVGLAVTLFVAWRGFSPSRMWCPLLTV